MPEYYRLIQTKEFEDWLENETPRSRYQIDARLVKIQFDGYFGNKKSVSQYDKGVIKNQIWELIFNDGRRIYYAIIPEKNMLLLLGGNKNGQEKDIKKAKALFIKNANHEHKEK